MSLPPSLRRRPLLAAALLAPCAARASAARWPARWIETADNRFAVELRLPRALPAGQTGAWTLQPALPLQGAEPQADEGRVWRLQLAAEPPARGRLRIGHRALAGQAELELAPLMLGRPTLPPALRAQLPQPWLPRRPGWLALYEAAWAFLAAKRTDGDTRLGFSARYLDEGFDRHIYQWDSCFMALWALYAPGELAQAAMAALDNFYARQTPDGYIARTYDERSGQATGPDELNPPLFAWVEWRYWQRSGDASRLARVLPVLDRYWRWIERHAASTGTAGAVFNTDFGSGMDNSPRGPWVKRGAWVDLCAQQLLAAEHLVLIATQLGQPALVEAYEARALRLKALLNDSLWDESSGLYLDRREDGQAHRRATVASFWPLMTGAVPPERARTTIERWLKDPAHFNTPHRFPTLAASDPDFDARGHYWRGGVWAPTNYALIQGLARHDPAFAFDSALNHVERMAAVFSGFDPARHPQRMPPFDHPNVGRNGNGRQQIWEAYAPMADAPATRWDGELLVRQSFCGWSGLGPVALLIEQLLGIDLRADAGLIAWAPRLVEPQGIDRLGFRGGRVSLRLQPEAGGWRLQVSGDRALHLVLALPGQPPEEFDFAPGRHQRWLPA